jgi:hypothetical protein
MRYIDRIIDYVKVHPNISRVHKQVLVTRIEKPITFTEIRKARELMRREEAERNASN